ncbi:MAG: hypothetical protein ACKOBC_02815 [Hyphomicrobiales bacterium]|jgi:hypothetical protein
MSPSQIAHERKRIRHAAIIATKPDARFLVQLIAGAGTRNAETENKTAPLQGAAAYSVVMDSDLAVRSICRADSLNHAA